METDLDFALKGKTHLQKKCKIYLNGVAKKSVGSTEQV